MTINSYFRRVPLWVKTVPFDDVLLPRSVVFQNKEYPVTKVISFGELPHPASRLPVMKFIAVIEGREKELYHDVQRNRWYSLKQLSEKELEEFVIVRSQRFPKEYFQNILKEGMFLAVPSKNRGSSG